MEEYKDFHGYKVYRDGSIVGKWGRRLKCSRSPHGYYSITLSLGSKKDIKTYLVHRIVAECFIPNPDNKREVNHKNGNKLDNRVENLEWVTSSENKIHAYKNGLADPAVGHHNSRSKLNFTEANLIRELYMPWDRNFGTRGLSRIFHVAPSVIRSILSWKSYYES